MEYRDFEAELATHYDDAVRYCRSLGGRHGSVDADDVLQESLLKALTKFGTLKDRERFKPWLFTIITRTFYSHTRKLGIRASRFLSFEAAPAHRAVPRVDGPERYDDRELLELALPRLGRRERAAILLHEVAGFSVREVASIQGDLSISATKSRLSRARQKLRKHMRALEAGTGETPPRDQMTPGRESSPNDATRFSPNTDRKLRSGVRQAGAGVRGTA